jgi:nitrogen fixation NifU-like protein
LTTDLRTLYQQAVLEHSRRPRHMRALPEATLTRRLDNRTCGDWVELSLRIEAGVIREAAFRGEGCALAIAGADLYCETVTGRTVEDAARIGNDFRAALEGDEAAAARITATPAGCLLAAREFPGRRGCVTLGWGVGHLMEMQF